MDRKGVKEDPIAMLTDVEATTPACPATGVTSNSSARASGEELQNPLLQGVSMFRIPLRYRCSHYRDAIALGKLITWCGAGLMALACAASPAKTSMTTVPEDVHALVAPTDKLLAYKPADLYGDGTPDAVIVVRHTASEHSDYDFESNPCELVVLRREKGRLVEVDRSRKAVDCTYNDVARNAPPMSLNDNLTLAPGSIVYVNQKEKGDSTLYFAWSKERSAWYLQRATASNADSGTGLIHASAIYPENLVWTPMSSVDPEAIAEILQKHRKKE